MAILDFDTTYYTAANTSTTTNYTYDNNSTITITTSDTGTTDNSTYYWVYDDTTATGTSTTTSVYIQPSISWENNTVTYTWKTVWMGPERPQPQKGEQLELPF